MVDILNTAIQTFYSTSAKLEPPVNRVKNDLSGCDPIRWSQLYYPFYGDSRQSSSLE